MNLQYKYNKNILIIQINLKYFLYSHINTRINWFQTNQDICLESNVSGDGETRTLTPLLVPDSNSGVSTFHHTPINPGFIHLKETKETLVKNLQDPQSLRIRYPFNNMVNGLWEERDSNPRTLMGADCGM